MPGFLNPAASSPNPRLSQDDLQWTEPGKRGLQEVESNKRGKPQPIGTMIMCQYEAEEDKGPGEPADNHFHSVILLGCV